MKKISSEKIKVSVVDVLKKALLHSLDNIDFLQEIDRAFCDKYSQIIHDQQRENAFLEDSLKVIADKLGLDFSISYNFKDLSQGVNSLIEQIKPIEESTPKNRYLVYSFSDDCGHTYCDILLKKDIEVVKQFITVIVEVSCFEDVMDEKSTLAVDISAKSGKDFFEVVSDAKDSSKDGFDVIEDFLIEAVEDESVSLELFSKYVQCLIPDNRHSGSSCKWVYL